MRESEKTIGERIRDQRLKKGFTQDYLANELHVSPQAISKWETGQTTPDITLLMPLSRVLEISVNELLGGDRRSFFEEKWQKSLAFGEEITLLVAEEALKEFPDDETFLYRRACDEYFLGMRQGGRNHNLNCAAAHFDALNRRFPDNDSYKEMLAQTYFAQGRKEKALALAYTCEESSALIEEFSEGEEKLRLKQAKIRGIVYDLYRKLVDYNTHESIKAAFGLLDGMLGEDKVISGKDCWKLCVKDAILYLDEGNLEAYAEKLTKAYELAKAYDELPRGPIEYKAPLFDRLIVDDERREQEELLIGLLSDEKLCHAASADLRRRMVEETLEYRRLHPFWWKRYYDFCRKYISDDHFSNFGTEWHLSEEEIGNRFNRIKNLPHGHERLIRIYKEEIEKLITSGVMRGYVAELGETICAFCHCGPKESFEEYKCHEQMGVPPLPEGSKILSVVEFMVPWGLKGCGIEEKLLSLALKEAKELGFTHAEIYPLERMIIRDGQYFFDNIEMYKRLGFEIVFDMSTEDYGIDYVMQKKL